CGSAGARCDCRGRGRQRPFAAAKLPCGPSSCASHDRSSLSAHAFSGPRCWRSGTIRLALTRYKPASFITGNRGEAMTAPFNFGQLKFLKALTEALFHEAEMVISPDQVVANVCDLFAKVGGTKLDEIRLSLTA